jgi:hypothetical protein
MTVDEAAAAILHGSKLDIDQLRHDLKTEPDLALGVLGTLAEHSNAMVRDWVTSEAPQALGSRAVALLQRLTEDRDPDVRIDAMRGLVAIDDHWARRLVPKYLEMLKGGNFVDQLDAIWRLVQFREPTAAIALRRVVDEATVPAVRNNARAGYLVLEGAEDGLIERLKQHEHALAALWLKALIYLGTQRALNAVEAYARDAPDPECRERARRAFEAREKVRPLRGN